MIIFVKKPHLFGNQKVWLLHCVTPSNEFFFCKAYICIGKEKEMHFVKNQTLFSLSWSNYWYEHLNDDLIWAINLDYKTNIIILVPRPSRTIYTLLRGLATTVFLLHPIFFIWEILALSSICVKCSDLLKRKIIWTQAELIYQFFMINMSGI